MATLVNEPTLADIQRITGYQEITSENDYTLYGIHEFLTFLADLPEHYRAFFKVYEYAHVNDFSLITYRHGDGKADGQWQSENEFFALMGKPEFAYGPGGYVKRSQFFDEDNKNFWRVLYEHESFKPEEDVEEPAENLVDPEKPAEKSVEKPVKKFAKKYVPSTMEEPTEKLVEEPAKPPVDKGPTKVRVKKEPKEKKEPTEKKEPEEPKKLTALEAEQKKIEDKKAEESKKKFEALKLGALVL